MNKNKPIRSAIYLSGNKYKLFKDIAPHLEGRGNRKVLMDLFTGSGCISLNAVNCGLGFDNIIANDGEGRIIDIHNKLSKTSNLFIEDADFVDKSYPSTAEGFHYLRSHYNLAKGASPEALYCLNVRSNSNMMRWNSSGEYNMTFGERNCFSKTRLEKHAKLCKDVEFLNLDFSQALDVLYSRGYDFKDVVIYIDSPYSGTIATYNIGWTEANDRLLLSRVKALHQEGAKIVMSNVFENRGYVNQGLIDWCEGNKDLFEVYDMKISYANSSFRKSDKKTREVLIVSKHFDDGKETQLELDL